MRLLIFIVNCWLTRPYKFVGERVHFDCLWGGRVYEIVAFYHKLLVNPPLQIRLVTSNLINVSAVANRSKLLKL